MHTHQHAISRFCGISLVSHNTIMPEAATFSNRTPPFPPPWAFLTSLLPSSHPHPHLPHPHLPHLIPTSSHPHHTSQTSFLSSCSHLSSSRAPTLPTITQHSSSCKSSIHASNDIPRSDASNEAHHIPQEDKTMTTNTPASTSSSSFSSASASSSSDIPSSSQKLATPSGVVLSLKSFRHRRVNSTTLITKLGSQGKWKEALNIIQQCPSPDIVMYNAAITACANARKIDKAADLFRELCQGGRHRNGDGNIDHDDEENRYEITNGNYHGNIHPNAGRGHGDFSFQDLSIRVAPDILSYNAMLSAFSLTGQWKLAIQGLRIMLATSHSTSIRSIPVIESNRPLQQFFSNHPDSTHLFQNLSHLYLPPPNVISFNTCINACVNAKEFTVALSLLEAMVNMHSLPRPNQNTWNTCLKACARDGRADIAVKLLDEMERYTTRTSSASRKGTEEPDQMGETNTDRCTQSPTDRDTSRDTINDQPIDSSHDLHTQTSSSSSSSPDTISYNSVISACSKAALKVTTERRFMHRSRKYSSKSKAAYYSTLALNVFQRMQENYNVQPDLITYNALIDTFANEAEPKLALEYLNRLIHQGLQPDQYTFSSCIRAAERANRLTRPPRPQSRPVDRKPGGAGTKDSIDEAANNNVTGSEQPTKDSANVTGQEESGKDYVDLFIEIMKQQQVPLNLVICNNCLQVYATQRDFKKLLSFLQEMKGSSDSDIHPDEFSYTIAISACAQPSCWDLALDLLYQLKSTPYLKPNVVSYSSCINACAKVGQHQRALELLDEMQTQYDLHPNVYTYTACITACSKAGEVHKAGQLLHEMRRRGIRPNPITYGAAIQACRPGAQWRRSLVLLRRMRRIDSLSPNIFHYNACIESCANAGMWKVALQLMERMRKEGVKPDKVSYYRCISACEKSGQLAISMKLLDQMRNDSIS